MKAGSLFQEWTCPKCAGHDGEWFDCLTHSEDWCFVLRCDDCDYESYDHDDDD